MPDLLIPLHQSMLVLSSWVQIVYQSLGHLLLFCCSVVPHYVGKLKFLSLHHIFSFLVFWHLTFRQETFWHGYFIFRTFWHVGSSSSWTFKQGDYFKLELFRTRTSCHRAIFAYGAKICQCPNNHVPRNMCEFA